MLNKNNLFLSIIILLLITALSACSVFEVSLPASQDVSESKASEEVLVTESEFTMEPTTEYFEDTSEAQEDFGLSFMTLEEKIAQKILLSCHENIDIEDAIEKGVGGLCLYSHSFEDKTFDEVVDMTSSFQNTAAIALIISTDEEGGYVNRVSINENLRAVPFYSPSDLFVEGGWELVESDTEEKAELLLSLGINVNLAPVCDVALSEDNYIYDRTFSLSASETGDYVELVVSVMKEKGIGSTLKHFPGYGGSVDTHEYISYDDRDYSDFVNNDFIPFERGIASGADSVLVSHNIVTSMDPDMPASLSKSVHDILRNDLGFQGVIITDDLIMEGITQFTDNESAAVYAVLAGNDMLCCRDYEESISSILNAVNNGLIAEEQIDNSVSRILKWKSDLNLL